MTKIVLFKSDALVYTAAPHSCRLWHEVRETKGTGMEVKFMRGWLVGLIVLFVSGAAYADSSEGFRLSQTCAGCHGTSGASPGNTIPILGGQNAKYLADTMHAYQKGEREFYVMNIIAHAYNDAQIGAIADWFSSHSWIDTPTPNKASKATIGAPIAAAKCVECHGPNGKGGDLGPRIAGQPVAYLAKVMAEYKAGSRTNSNALQMIITRDLSDDDIEALAHYYARLR